MLMLRHPMPRTDARHRALGQGYPLWIFFSQLYIVMFVFRGFETVGEGTPLANPKPYFLISMTVAAAIVLFSPRGTIRRTQFSMSLVTFVSWWVLSYLWTPVPGTWLNTSMTELTAMAILTIVASTLPFDRTLAAWMGSIYAMIIYTLLYTAAFPAKATILANAGTGELVNVGWHGAFDHKNNMAAFMIMASAVVLSFEKVAWRRRSAVGAMIVLVVLSRSGTGGGALIAVLMSLQLTRRYSKADVRRGGAIVVTWMVALIAASVSLIIALPSVVKLYGKDLTFSGRTEIWSASLAAIRAKPWTGYSWGGVWIDPTTEPTFEIVRRLGFIVFHAHNGAIEIMIELGIIGLVLYLALFLSTVTNGWRLLRVQPALGQVVFAFCILVIVSSITEVLVIGPWLSLLVYLKVLSQRVLHGARSSSPLPGMG